VLVFPFGCVFPFSVCGFPPRFFASPISPQTCFFPGTVATFFPPPSTLFPPPPWKPFLLPSFSVFCGPGGELLFCDALYFLPKTEKAASLALLLWPFRIHGSFTRPACFLQTPPIRFHTDLGVRSLKTRAVGSILGLSSSFFLPRREKGN